MRTLIVSDLHLGARTEVDLARQRQPRARLMEAFTQSDRIVLLGDTLELRHGPLREVLAQAREFFEQLGANAGEREIVLVAGNHDHGLVMPWLDGRRRAGAPLGLEHTVRPAPGDALTTLIGWLGDANARIAYPGVWLRDDLYATHGHYLDRHITVPSFERIAIGASERLGRVAHNGGSPSDYEAALGPVYAWNYERAQGAPAQANTGPGPSARAYEALVGIGPRTARSRALAVAFPALVALLNRAGIGPLRADVSGPTLRRAALAAAGEFLARLGVQAEHVVIGHTHRAGPFPDDDQLEWCTPSGARLYNSGSWIFERHFHATVTGDSPYWPGTCVIVEDDRPPRVERLLDAGYAELRA
jgi:Calcineurin-like phosphoesterase